MRVILFVVGAALFVTNALGQTKFDQAVARVQVRLGWRILVNYGTVNEHAFLFPKGSLPGEAWVARDAMYVSREKIAAMKSGRELAQFMAHAMAHGRLNASLDFAEHQQLLDTMQLTTPHLPPEIMERSWAAWCLKHEEEAKTLGEQFFAGTDCGRGKCKEFDELLKEARTK
jgi:hypothetical protein